MAYYGSRNLYKELVTLQLAAGAIGVVTHRLFGKPNEIRIKHVSGDARLVVTASDADDVTFQNVGAETGVFEVELVRFKADQADVGTTDKILASESDGIANYQRIVEEGGNVMDKLITFEDPWVRYVDGTLGADTNDGKTAGAGGAWATIAHALSQLPRIRNTAIIKIADGTYTEALVIEPGMGNLSLIGGWTELYTGGTGVTAAAATYKQYDTTDSVEGWTSMVLGGDLSVLPGPNWNYLIGQYVEFEESGGPSTLRMQIVDADFGNSRIFLGGMTPPAAITDGQTVTFVTESVTITHAAALATLQVYGDPTTPNQIANQTVLSSARGVMLHGLKIGTTNPGGLAVYSAPGSSISIGQATLIHTTSGSLIRGSVTEPIDYAAGYGAAVWALIESRVGTIMNVLGISGNSHLTVFGNIVNVGLFLHGATAEARFYGDYNLKNYLKDFRSNNAVLLLDGADVTMFNRVGMQYLRYVDDDFGDSSFKFSYNGVAEGAVDGQMNFTGNPNATYGRIYMSKGKFTGIGFLNMGTLNALDLAVPLVTVTKQSSFRAYGMNVGSGANILTIDGPLNSVILIDLDSTFTLEGENAKPSLVMYLTNIGAPTGNPLAIIIDDVSKAVIIGQNAIGIDIHTDVPYGENEASLLINDESLLHCDGSIVIAQAGSGGTGHDILVFNSEVFVGGNVTITTDNGNDAGGGTVAWAGYSLVIIESRWKIVGTTSIDDVTAGAEGGVYIEGMHSDIYFGDTVTIGNATSHDGCSVAVSPLVVTGGARCVHYGDINIASQDYVAVNLISYFDLADVHWIHEVHDADADWNDNTNAGAGYGLEIKRGARLTCNQNNEGPDGGAGEIDLGVAGASLWPPANASINDLVGGANEDGVFVICFA